MLLLIRFDEENEENPAESGGAFEENTVTVQDNKCSLQPADQQQQQLNQLLEQQRLQQLQLKEMSQLYQQQLQQGRKLYNCELSKLHSLTGLKLVIESVTSL